MKHRWLLGSAVLENLLQDIIVRSIEENADFQSRSGMTPKIIRKTDGNCCEWCSQMAGTYSYPDVPDDVYRRHKNCTCTVEYYPGDGRKQNVWTKKWDDDPDLRERRKKVGLKEQDPGVLALRRSVGLKETEPEELERRKQIGFENTEKKSIIKSDKQFGEKIGKHAKDYNLDPSNPNDREAMRKLIDEIYDFPDEVREGTWRGYKGKVVFSIKGEDVVISQNGNFITILKEGVSNARVKNARKRKI